MARLEVAGLSRWGMRWGSGGGRPIRTSSAWPAGLIARGYDRDGSVVAITAAGRREVGADKGDVRSGATQARGCGTRARCRGSLRC